MDLIERLDDLSEAHMKPDGTIRLRLIAPGQGTSGYYPPDVLRRDGPQVFKAGTHMFWDHPSLTEGRPERSLRDLAARLVTDATWEENGPGGAGLYADAAVFSNYRPLVEEMAPHIGVSIRASGGRKMATLPDGTKGQLVERIVKAGSVDFVTEAGAGGRVVEMVEAARPQEHKPADLADKYVVADLIEATPIPTDSEEEYMDTKELQEAVDRAVEAKLTPLTEANAALTTRLDETVTKLEEAQRKLAQGDTMTLLREARDHVTSKVPAGLPDAVKVRIVEAASANPAVTEAGALDLVKLDEATKTEVASWVATLSEAGFGKVTGLGDSAPVEVDAEKATGRLESAMARFGLSESAAKTAAAGRR